MSLDLSRRRFTQAAGAALTVAIAWPLASTAQQAAPGLQRNSSFPRLPHSTRPAPASYIRITPDNWVTFILPTSEMGQCIHTGQAMVLAEELGADWQRVRTEMPAQTRSDFRVPLGQQRSVGSFGIRYWHDPLRRAAAQVREMLTLAASQRLGVAPGSLRAENGFILHADSRRRLAFGELVAEAAAIPVPRSPCCARRTRES